MPSLSQHENILTNFIKILAQVHTVSLLAHIIFNMQFTCQYFFIRTTQKIFFFKVKKDLRQRTVTPLFAFLKQLAIIYSLAHLNHICIPN